MRNRLSAVVLVAATLAAGGCGDGSSQTPASGATRSSGSLPSGGPLSRSELIARADAICLRLNNELAATAAKSVGMREIARVSPRHAALEQTAVMELSKLTPPASIARDWRQIVAYRQTLAEELALLGRYAKVKNARSVRALAVSKKHLHRQLTTVATRDGFKRCSRLG
jgi:hypothetical protein